MKKCIVLFSGGQDSTTCLFWAIARYGVENVIAIGFDYGQKHAVELVQARKIADLAGVEYKIFDMQKLLGGSSLTDHTKDVNAPHDQNSNLPSSFTAGRNAMFLTVAGSYGYSLGIHDIITGVCQTDFSGYPDCRRKFVDAQQLALTLALDEDIRIHTPLMYLTKAETWKMATDINNELQFSYFLDEGNEKLDVVEIVRTMTLTDYNGSMKMNEWGMGELNNPASELRAKGYFEAKEKGWI